ncbi:MAG TPA: hypothetical protein ENI20_01525 [Bacteroides sp.]|nr:hypothetical protein [Bacteroides sp.]
MSDLYNFRVKHLWVFSIGVFILMLSACNSEEMISIRQKSVFRTSEKRAIKSYLRYINELRTPGFKLSAFQIDEDLPDNPACISMFQNDKNVQFFPATLWQLYALNGKSRWKEYAEEYSRLLIEGKISGSPDDDEIIQGVFMNSFLITGNQQYKTTLLKLLSHHILAEEKSSEPIGNTGIYGDSSFEKLLENQLLLFTTKETGDPVYRRLAIDNSQSIYNLHFQYNRSNELYFGLANWEQPQHFGELEDLSTQDCYRLALCFYAFTVLGNEIEIVRYQDFTENLAVLFTAVFDDVKGESRPQILLQSSVAGKVDLLSRIFVCLAFNNMGSNEENEYEEIAETIFDSVLEELDDEDISAYHNYTFRMYYYLFEYLREV